MSPETVAKLKALRVALSSARVDAAMFWHRNNFAWLTGGADNHILHAGPVGVACLLVTPDRLVCLCDTIESPRFRDEELAGLEIEVIDYPWYEPGAGKRVAQEILENRKLAADFDAYHLGALPIPQAVADLRLTLNEQELERYRIGGRLAAEALEAACLSIKPSMTEHQIAAEIDREVRNRGAKAVVNLVAVDHRIDQFRHPIPTDTRLKKVAMLVVCSEKFGLISNVTRFVHFGKVPAELVAKVQAVADIDATVNLATKPGRSWKDIFAQLTAAYERAGYADQWKFHHQGGSTGYAGREAFINPTHANIVLDRQAYAWNPSVVGFKSEDTLFVTRDKDVEVLTAHSKNWPTVVGHAPSGELARAGVLER